MRTLTAAAFLGSVIVCSSSAQENWNATPNDVNNLLKNMQSMIGADYSMDIKSLAEVSPDPEQNPILYRSGHYNFSYTPEERRKLREFLLAGGMIVFNTGLGSAPFYRSAKQELQAIFPEQPLQRLSSDHPIFHSYYDLDKVEYCPGVYKTGFKGQEPWFDGVEINCRVVALLSRWGMAVGWEGKVEDDFQAYQPDSAMKLGVNIFSYASAMRAWAKSAAQAMKFVDKEESSADKVAMVQIVYDGVWRTRHAGLSVLLQTFNRKTSIPVKFGLKEMRLSNDGIFNAPLLYMSGHENFQLNPQELLQLRKYLESGGFLFAEACCGRKGFDLSFRQLIRDVFPALPMQRIGEGASVFTYPNDVQTVGATPTLSADLGRSTTRPWLEGVELNGHYVVIYSPLGMAGGWEMSPSPYARGYNALGAVHLGQNILMYAVTQ